MIPLRLLLPFLFLSYMQAQKTVEETLEKYNSGTVPYISTRALAASDQYALLDSRTWEEYQVSHLQDAVWVGHASFDIDRVTRAFPDKNTPLVVYCSVGVRSEDIGEKLLDAGYTQVKNLYGGIFEWKNQGHRVFDPEGNATSKVHAFSKHWGKLLTNADKVY